MIPELTVAVVMLDAYIDFLAVLYFVSKGYFGHPRRKGSIDSAASVKSYTPPQEQSVGGPAAVATTVVEPAPSSVQAIYETVQPTPAPVHYAAPSTTSFGAPSISKPTRTYRRRPAPVRSTAAYKASLNPKREER